ncbi:hypothetical protein ILUMI_12244, partial [Ignelater luminosus]
MKISFCLTCTVIFSCDVLGFITYSSDSKTPRKHFLCLVKDLILPEEKIQFIYESYDEDYLSLLTIENVRLIVRLDRPMKKLLDLCNVYVILIENYDLLNCTLSRLKQSSIWNESRTPRGKFIIVVPNLIYIKESLLIDIFWKHDITCVTIIAQNPTSSNWSAHPLSILKDKLHLGNRNIKSRPSIKMIMPYMINISETKELYVNAVYGTMFNYLKIVGKALGMDATFILTKTPKEFIYDNSVDIYLLLCTSRDLRFYEDYDVSDYFFRDIVTWAVPKFEMSSLGVILSIFKWTVWLTIIAVLVGVTIMWWLFGKSSNEHKEFDSFQSCILSTVVIILNNPINVLPKSNVLRILTLFHLIFSIQISQYFQGKLSSVLTHPEKSSISTIEELADSSLEIIGSEKINKLMLERKDNPVFLRIQKRLIREQLLNLTDNLMKVAYYRNCSSVIGKKILRYAFPNLMPMVSLIEYNSGLLEMEITFAMRKGHYFLDILNTFGRRISQAGFYKKIFTDAISKSYKTTMIEETKELVVLTFRHLKGLFILWFLGLLVATFVFIAEISHLISVLTHPKTEPEIRTIEELSESQFLLLGTSKTKNMILERVDNLVYKKIYNKIIVKDPFNITRDLIHAANSRNYGVIMGKQILRHVFPQLVSKVYLLEYHSGLQELELSYAVPKGHYILNTLNNFCRGITEGGLYKKMFNDFVSRNSKNIKFEKDPDKIVSLGIHHVRGLFLWWLSGLLIASSMITNVTLLTEQHSNYNNSKMVTVMNLDQNVKHSKYVCFDNVIRVPKIHEIKMITPLPVNLSTNSEAYIQSIYANLISVLTHPKREPELRTIEELSESGFLLLGTSKTKNMILEHAQNPVYKKIHDKIIATDPFNVTRDVIRTINSRKYGTIMGKKVLHHVFPQFLTKLYLLEYHSGLQELDLSFAVLKGHYILNALNNYRRGITEGGLYKKMFNDFASKSTKNIKFDKESNKIVSLGIQHVRGLFL